MSASTNQILIDHKSMVHGSYKIIVINLANAVRDHDNNNFLSDRFDAILSGVKDLQPDILIFLEWGRWPVDANGFKLTPGKIVDRVDEELGLTFYTATRANASSLALGKAVFYRTSSIWIDTAISQMISTTGWGSDMLTLLVAPVQNGKISACGDHICNTGIGIVHAPVPFLGRKDFYDKLLANSEDLPPIMVGDFNTFIGCSAATEFLAKFSGYYQDLMPPGNTFKGYPYDVVKIPAETYDPAIHVGERIGDDKAISDTHVEFIPESRLDHVFIERSFPNGFEVELYDWSQNGKNGLPPSDHKIIEITVMY